MVKQSTMKRSKAEFIAREIIRLEAAWRQSGNLFKARTLRALLVRELSAEEWEEIRFEIQAAPVR